MYSMPDERKRIFKSTADLQPADIRSLYDGFHSAITGLDCGKKCAPHNPSGKPFCCDICPLPMREWKYLEPKTEL
jgi:hypothetical protein